MITKCIAFLVLILALAACGGGQAAPTATPPPPQMEISLAVEPDPPAVGGGELLVSLRDAAGEPVTGAQVRARGDMDHEGMEAVTGEAAGGDDGLYRVPFEWTMGGNWVIEVSATLADNRVVSEEFALMVEAVSEASVIHEDDDDANAEDDTQEAGGYDAATLIMGEGLYSTCAACHGPDGRGIANLGKDLVDSAFVAELSDEELLAFVKQGRPSFDPENTTGVDMPPRGGNPSLTDEQILAIIAYMRSLGE